jgi:CheY-like chemotaxis protein
VLLVGKAALTLDGAKRLGPTSSGKSCQVDFEPPTDRSLYRLLTIRLVYGLQCNGQVALMIPEGQVAILVVDDESSVREILRDVLLEEGFAVYSAAHGAEALEILAQCQLPSLILLDVMMPVMDGVQFLKELRSREELKRIPVLVTSATSQKPQAAEGFLPKPFALSTLLEAVHRYVRPDRPASMAPA